MNKYLLCLTCSVITLTNSNLAMAGPLNISHIHTQHTLGLKPISDFDNSYNIAASVFLPDVADSIGFAGSKTESSHETSSENCNGFSLSPCPTHAKCLKCSFANKYKITGCDTNYKLSGNSCIAKTCSEINSLYKAEVPVNQLCTIIGNCYSSCKNIDFSGYPLNSCPAGANCATHPDCNTTSTAKGNCSPAKKKITSCASSTQKINSAGTDCINKDDTCPNNYFKTCATGTIGSPQYTELGSACYQCKAANAAIADILFSDMSTSPIWLPEKTPIGVVFDTTNKLAIGLEFKQGHWSTTAGNFGTTPYTDTVSGSYIARNDTKGKENTATLVANGGTKVTAAYYCYNYTTTGTSAHDWFLPSGSQAKTIQQNYSAINKTLKTLGKSSLPSSYWTSTSCDAYGAFHINGTTGHGCGTTGNGGKTDGNRYIIPVIRYAD